MISLLCLTLLFHSSAAWLSSLNVRDAHLRSLAAGGRSDIASQLFTQKLDHFNVLETRTWKQRYWVNDEFFNAGGPIYFQIGGEGAASSAYVTDALTMYEYGKTHGALLIALEHRFYGQSHPLDSLTDENLKFLTSQQALADAVEFVAFIRRQYSANGSKVVAFGGSYPGALAAWARTTYPWVFSFAVSTSSPVLAVLDMTTYLGVVDKSLRAIGGQQCDDEVAKAFKTIDALLTNENGRAKLSQMFNTCTPITSNADDIATFLSNIIGNIMTTVQYDNEIPGAPDIREVCRIMEQGSRSSLDRFVTASQLFGNMCVSTSYLKMVAQLRDTTNFNPGGVGIRQWTWQTCNEFGFFQSTDGSASVQPFGVGVPVSYYTRMCRDVFGNGKNETVSPHIAFTNLHYGGKEGAAAVGNVLFVNNGLDPWKSLSVTVNQTATVRAIVTPDAGHCANMRPYQPGMPPGLQFTQFFINRALGQI